MENNFVSQITSNGQKTGKSRRGFASMDKERHKLVSSKGGKAIRTTYSSRNQEPAVSTVSVSPLN